MNLEDRIILLAQKIADDMNMATKIKPVEITIPTSTNHFEIGISDTSITPTSNIIATIATRDYSYDNCGDDMDNILVTARGVEGGILLSLTHSDPGQDIIGTFLINYKND